MLFADLHLPQLLVFFCFLPLLLLLLLFALLFLDNCFPPLLVAVVVSVLEILVKLILIGFALASPGLNDELDSFSTSSEFAVESPGLEDESLGLSTVPNFVGDSKSSLLSAEFVC